MIIMCTITIIVILAEILYSGAENTSRVLAEIDTNYETADRQVQSGPLSNTTFLSKNVKTAAVGQTVRLLCWVMTYPRNHKLKARHVKATWGQRCNILLFISSEYDEELPTVKLDVTEGHDYLWQKTRGAFHYAFEKYFDQADWFLKADDDTYVIVENLRFMLSKYNPNDALHFGLRFNKTFVISEKSEQFDYMSGGSGYVLSREALKRFATEGLSNTTLCAENNDTGAEDFNMGTCLQRLNVKMMDSRDRYERDRFVFYIYTGDDDVDLIRSQLDHFQFYFRSKTGFDCCSDFAVSFHYVQSLSMYLYDYFIHTVKVYGVQRKYKLSDLYEAQSSYPMLGSHGHSKTFHDKY